LNPFSAPGLLRRQEAKMATVNVTEPTFEQTVRQGVILVAGAA